MSKVESVRDRGAASYGPDFDDAIDWVIGWETGWDYDTGGYNDHPTDEGGPTRWGFAQKYNPDIDINKIDLPQAVDRYHERYWKPVERMVPDGHGLLRKAVFEGYLNGPQHTVKALQRAVGANPDGRFGPKTRSALQAAIDSKPEEEIVSDYYWFRNRGYEEKAANDPKHGAPNLQGWKNRISSAKRHFGVR